MSNLSSKHFAAGCSEKQRQQADKNLRIDLSVSTQVKVRFGMEANLDQGLVKMRAWQPLNTVWCNEEVNKKVMLVSRKEVLSVKFQDSLVRNVSSSHSLAGWEVYLSCDASFYKGPSAKLKR